MKGLTLLLDLISSFEFDDRYVYGVMLCYAVLSQFYALEKYNTDEHITVSQLSIGIPFAACNLS